MHMEYKVLSPTTIGCNKFDQEENDQDVHLLVESLLKVLIALEHISIPLILCNLYIILLLLKSKFMIYNHLFHHH